MSQPKNIILTGMPRSGTSLACHLLSQIDNLLALQEPMEVSRFGQAGGYQVIKKLIDDFFSDMRHSAITRGEVVSKHVDGKTHDNYFVLPDQATGIRQNISSRGYIKIGKEVNPDVTLVVKHNAAFLALISELKNDFPTFAIIRHPLWALASWNSNQLPIYNGRMPMAEQLDRKLAQALDEIPDGIDRQIYILNWIFERVSLLDANRIIRYEDIIATSGRILRVIDASAEELSESLKNSNSESRYQNLPLSELKHRLLKRGGLFLEFYPDMSTYY